MSQPPRFPGSPPSGARAPQWGSGEPPQRPPVSQKPPGFSRPGSRRLVIGASVLALLMLVAGAIGAVTYQASAQRAEAYRKAELAQQRSTARAAAHGFFTALTESDADKALGFAASAPEGNNQLLSREVLLESNTRAPITRVNVAEPALAEEAPGAWSEGTVPVRYSIGDQLQSVDLPVRKVGAEWKVGQVAAPVEFGRTGPERMVNGVQVMPGQYNLFPGSYSVTSANPLMGMSRSEFVLETPGAIGTDWSSDVMLSDEGTQQSIEASKRAVYQCLQTSELKPPNCPFIEWAESDGLSIERDTIRYALKNDPWQDAAFAFDADTMTASASIPVEHEIRAQATRNGTPGTLIPQTQRRTAHIIVKVEDGTPEVTFS